MPQSPTIVNVLFSGDEEHSGVLSLHHKISELVEEKNFQVVNLFLTGEHLSGTDFPGVNLFWKLDKKTLRQKGLLNRCRYKTLRKRMMTFLESQKASVVLCDGITVIRLISAIQKSYPVKGIGIFHGMTRFKNKDVKRLSENQALWHFVAVSEGLKSQLKENCSAFDDDCLRVIFNALNFSCLEQKLLPMDQARQVLGVEGKRNVFGCIGRLDAVKRHKIIIKAVSILKQQKSWPDNAQVVIIGEGELRPKLLALIDELSLQNEVILAGAKPNAVQYIKAFNAFIMPSNEREAFGIALLEGCAAKIPVIVSDTPTFRMITGNRARYFSVDNADMLADEMKRVMAMTEEEKNQVGHAIFSHVKKKFDVTAFKQSYWQLISDVCL